MKFSKFGLFAFLILFSAIAFSTTPRIPDEARIVGEMGNATNSPGSVFETAAFDTYLERAFTTIFIGQMSNGLFSPQQLCLSPGKFDKPGEVEAGKDGESVSIGKPAHVKFKVVCGTGNSIKGTVAGLNDPDISPGSVSRCPSENSETQNYCIIALSSYEPYDVFMEKTVPWLLRVLGFVFGIIPSVALAAIVPLFAISGLLGKFRLNGMKRKAVIVTGITFITPVAGIIILLAFGVPASIIGKLGISADGITTFIISFIISQIVFAAIGIKLAGKIGKQKEIGRIAWAAALLFSVFLSIAFLLLLSPLYIG